MQVLDKKSMIPLYVQLAQLIELDIREGKYQPGTKIHSEAEYMDAYKVSRVTVRLAMKYLLDRNLILRKRGMGTFVQQRGVSQTFDELFGFYESLRRKGLNPRIRLMDYKVVSPNLELRENLQLQPGEKVLKFVRRYFLNNEVLVIAQMHIPMTLARHWTKQEASVKNSFRLIEEQAGVHISHLVARIRASVANAKVATWLGIPKKSPVMEIRRLAFSADQQPLEYCSLIFRGDSYELVTQISAGRLEQFRVGKADSQPVGLQAPNSPLVLQVL